MTTASPEPFLVNRESDAQAKLSSEGEQGSEGKPDAQGKPSSEGEQGGEGKPDAQGKPSGEGEQGGEGKPNPQAKLHKELPTMVDVEYGEKLDFDKPGKVLDKPAELVF